MRKLTQIEFGLLNLVIFALTLPAYLAWSGATSSLALRICLIVLVGASGWLGFGFLVIGLIFKFVYRKYR